MIIRYNNLIKSGKGSTTFIFVCLSYLLVSILSQLPTNISSLDKFLTIYCTLSTRKKITISSYLAGNSNEKFIQVAQCREAL